VSSVLAALTFARGPSCDLIPLLIWPVSLDLGLVLDMGIWAGFPAQYGHNTHFIVWRKQYANEQKLNVLI